jgi:hypothetical protein
MKTMIVGMVAAFIALLPSPANAYEYNEPYNEDCTMPDYQGRAEASLCYPVAKGRIVVIEATNGGIWKMKVFAEQLDAALPGLDVRSAMCYDFPGAFCLRVSKVYEPSSGWVGIMEWDTTGSNGEEIVVHGGTIRLNMYYKGGGRTLRQSTAAHEFMHALGFKHHGANGGVIGPYVGALTPIPTEWQALLAYYGGTP